MGLSQAQLQVTNPVLTDMAQRIGPGNLISQIVAPPLSGEKPTKTQMQVWDKRNLMIQDDNYRGIGQEALYSRDAEPSYIDVVTVKHAQKLLVTAEELKRYADSGQMPIALEMVKTKLIVDQLKLQEEKALSDKLNTTANYESGYSTTLTTTWEEVGGDPLGDIDTAINAIEAQVTPNAAVMDIRVWRALERHTDLLEFMKYTKGGKITKADFVSITGLVPIVSNAKYYTGSAMAAVWGDSCIVAYIPGITENNMGVMDGVKIDDTEASFCRTVYSRIFGIKTYDANELDFDGAYWVEGELAYVHQFGLIDNTTDKDSVGGYLIDNAI